MSDDNVEKLSGIIPEAEKLSGINPEAWYDLISKVVPGTVIVWASFRTDLVSGSPLGGFAVGLVVVYVVGFVFEVTSDCLFGWVLTLRGWVLTKLRVLTLRGWVLTTLESFMDWIYCYPYRKLWEEIDKQPPPLRERAGKTAAEGAMFKSLGVYELLQILLAILTHGGLIPCARLREIRVHSWGLSLFFAAVAFYCWIIMQHRVTMQLKSWGNTPNAGTKAGATK